MACIGQILLREILDDKGRRGGGGVGGGTEEIDFLE